MQKDIPGYENLYSIDENGNVFSYRSNCYLKWHNDNNNYYYVELSKNKERKCKKIHRLVAEIFLDNPNNLPCVNHKDEDRHNNNINNLEWCDYSYNNSYGNRMEKIKKSIINKEDHKQKVKVIMCDKKTHEELKIFNSVGDAAREVNGSHSNIVACMKGRQKSAYGYWWKYLE